MIIWIWIASRKYWCSVVLFCCSVVWWMFFRMDGVSIVLSIIKRLLFFLRFISNVFFHFIQTFFDVCASWPDAPFSLVDNTSHVMSYISIIWLLQQEIIAGGEGWIRISVSDWEVSLRGTNIFPSHQNPKHKEKTTHHSIKEEITQMSQASTTFYIEPQVLLY